MSGGMIQTQRRDGTWKDAFVTDAYKSHTTALRVRNKTTRPVRIVNSTGEVIFEAPGLFDSPGEDSKRPTD